MSDTLNPEEIARQIAVETAEEAGKVGGFVERLDLGDNVYDFRFESHLPGYEKWQWSVILFHDVEVDAWTVNESCLAPTEGALMPPEWVPWKDRLLPSDLSVTDALGTAADDPRLEDGFCKTGQVTQADSSEGEVVAAGTRAEVAGVDQTADKKAEVEAADLAVASQTEEDDDQADQAEQSSDNPVQEQSSELDEVVEEYRLSRRRVLSRLGRSEVAQRWYDGPHGPKALSTKTAGGKTCETCGFFIPLQGGLNTMFGVCANQWSPDDGRVVSLDHGCGEHSEIAPSVADTLWPDREPAFDDSHIDVVKQAPREEVAEVEVLESLDVEDVEAGTESEVNQAVPAQAEDEAPAETAEPTEPELAEEGADQSETVEEAAAGLADSTEPVDAEASSTDQDD